MKQVTPPEAAAIAMIDQKRALSRVCEWCAINSGTGNLEGLGQLAGNLTTALGELPGQVERIAAAPEPAVNAKGVATTIARGDHLILRVRPEASRRILLTGHMDTVFPADHAFQTLSWLDAETLNGPGVADMKGGIAVMLEALMAFETSPNAAQLGYDVLINADEETGSHTSAPVIARLAAGKFAALTYEPSALPDGTLAGARAGSGNFAVVIRGRSAHAGRNPEDGRNAIVAAAAMAMGLKQLETATLRLNPAAIEGGSAVNVVPDHAVLRFNMRARSTEESARFQIDLKALIDRIAREHEVHIHLHGGISRPPRPMNDRARRLFELVKGCGEALGQSIRWQDSGGVCDGNNIAACGVPVVDTLGVRGGSIHSPDEFLIVPSLSERAELSTLILIRLAEGALT